MLAFARATEEATGRSYGGERRNDPEPHLVPRLGRQPAGGCADPARADDPDLHAAASVPNTCAAMEGWTYVSSWFPFHYFKRPLDGDPRTLAAPDRAIRNEGGSR